MLSLLRDWILSISGAAVFCAVMTEICPKGWVKKVVHILCGMVMALALLSPLMELDMGSYSLNLARYRREGEKIVAGGKDLAETYSRTIIEEECRAYILDKAVALGLSVEDAQVSLRWSSEGFWYPAQCEIEGEYSASLSSAIAAELGITPESQKWSGDEDT